MYDLSSASAARPRGGKPRRSNVLRTTAVVVAWLIIAASANAVRFYVDRNAQGSQTGVDWTNAYLSPQPAFAAANAGDEVWIADGVYHPGAPGDISASFTVPAGVRVYGGFRGDETTLAQRRWWAYPTVLSGDLADDDQFGNPWYIGWNINSPNSLNVVKVMGGAPTTVLDGLIVSHGYGVFTSGAGVLATGSVLDVRNCTFRRNAGYQGIGSCVAVVDGFATFQHCDFRENWGRFVDGVGIGTTGTAGVNVDRCSFFDNHAETDSSRGNGAGIALEGSALSSVTRSTFEANYAIPFAANYISYGGAILNGGPSLFVDRCVFKNNQALTGGGIYSWRNLQVFNSLFDGNVAISTSQNGGIGGAIATYFFGNYTLEVYACTFAHNRAHEVAGVWFQGSGQFTSDIANCIFWDSQDVNGIVSQSSVKKARYSCIQNLWVTIPGEDPIDPEKFPNCTDAYPQFVNLASNYRLAASSPCIDAADKTVFLSSQKLDLDGLWRFIDVASVPDTGNGAAPLPDMGCYEYGIRKRVGYEDPFLQLGR